MQFVKWQVGCRYIPTQICKQGIEIYHLQIYLLGVSQTLKFFQNCHATMQLLNKKELMVLQYQKAFFCFVFPLLSLCSQHNLYFKKSCICRSGKISFFRIAACCQLAILNCVQFSKKSSCTYTGASCSNRRGIHRRILLLSYQSIFAPFTALKFSFDKNIMQTKIAPFKGYSCLYIIVCCRGSFPIFVNSWLTQSSSFYTIRFGCLRVVYLPYYNFKLL